MRAALARSGTLCLALLLALAPGAHAAYGEPPELLAEPYIATADNTLHDIAVVFDLGYVELLAANPGVDPWAPGEGTRVQLPTKHLLPDGERKGLIVNIGDQRVYFFKGEGEVESFPIGIGREGKSIPLGKTTITRKRENPTWIPTASIRAEKPELPEVVPPGPENPLGDYALNLGFPAYLLHGTNKPDGVGRRVSSGCIRLYPWDIEHLFQQVKVGTPVQVVDQPVKLEMIDGELYMEVHPAGRLLDEIEETGTFTPEPIPDLEKLVLEKAGEQSYRVDWSKVAQVAEERTGLPVRITGGARHPGLIAEEQSPLEAPPIGEYIPEPLPTEEPLPYRDLGLAGNSGSPMSLTERSMTPRPLETARDLIQEQQEPGAGIW